MEVGKLLLDAKCAALLLLGIVFYIFFLKKKLKTELPFTYFPDLSLLKELEITSNKPFQKLISLLFKVGCVSLVVALLNPVWKEELPMDSRLLGFKNDSKQALYLLADTSSSMLRPIFSNGSEVSKLDILKGAVTDVIRNNNNKDFIGLIGFSRKAVILSPLTLDHEFVLRKVKTLSQLEGHGTAIGYSLLKASHMMLQAVKSFPYKQQDSSYIGSIVLFTDGSEEIHPQDINHPFRGMGVMEAAKELKEKKIKVHVVHIQFEEEEYLENFFFPLRRLAEDTDGEFYIASSEKNLHEVVKDISLSEGFWRLPENSSKSFSYHLLYPYFLKLGLLCLCACLFIELFLERRSL
jgi:Ca-activated chloride channel homolog